MFTDRERRAYHDNAGGCPWNTKEDGCLMKPNQAITAHGKILYGECGEPEECGVLYWLKALGLLKLGVYELAMPKDPAPNISDDIPTNHNTRLNGAGN